MNSLMVQLSGQNPGFVINSAVAASVSTLNDRNVYVDLSVLLLVLYYQSACGYRHRYVILTFQIDREAEQLCLLSHYHLK